MPNKVPFQKQQIAHCPTQTTAHTTPHFSNFHFITQTELLTIRSPSSHTALVPDIAVYTRVITITVTIRHDFLIDITGQFFIELETLEVVGIIILQTICI